MLPGNLESWEEPYNK